MSKQPANYYVVMYEWNENGKPELSLREQDLWNEHASLMDALVDSGFIVLGGPIGEKAMLIVKAESYEAVQAQFADDPWIVQKIRRIASIERWEILLGTI